MMPTDLAMSSSFSSSSSSDSASPLSLARKLRRAKRRLFLAAVGSEPSEVPSQKSLLDEEESSFSSVEEQRVAKKIHYQEEEEEVISSPIPFSRYSLDILSPPPVVQPCPEPYPEEPLDGLRDSLFLPSLDDDIVNEEDMMDDSEPQGQEQDDDLVGLTLNLQPRHETLQMMMMEEDASGMLEMRDDQDNIFSHDYGDDAPHVYRPAPMHHDEIEGDLAVLTLDVPSTPPTYNGGAEAIFSPRPYLSMPNEDMLTLSRCNAFEEVATTTVNNAPPLPLAPLESFSTPAATKKQDLASAATSQWQPPERRASNKRVAAATAA